MPKIITGVHLTRMDLIKTNGKIKLATKGHRLLKEKRDALVSEFFRIVDQAKGVRGELTKDLVEGKKNIVKSRAIAGRGIVESIAEAAPEMGDIEFGFRNVMGIKIPVMEKEIEKPKKEILLHETHKIEEAQKNFRKVADGLVKLVVAEESVRRIGEETKKVRRRTNALEHIMIPNLIFTKRYIDLRLQEIERENFFRLKVIKRKMEK